MKRTSIFHATMRLFGLIMLTAAAIAAQTVPAPHDILGFTPGDDRKLASWAKVIEYFQKLDAASDRVMFQEIGKTTMGAPFVYATISSPENLRNLKKYKQINAKLADPRWEFTSSSIPKFRVKRYIEDGKTIVLITCGVHSTEVGSYLSSMLIAHRLASSNEPEIKKILDNTIILLVPSLNPDGVDIVKNWYDKTLGTPYEGTEPPELYHKYVGHDNNRDWYAFTQVETQLTVDKIHNVWHPQIVHDIHQQGANGSRLFLPPYMQPVEPNVPKQIVEGYTELGNFMAADLRKKGLEGITTNTTYDAWTPARAYSHYHGGVRILSETASAKIATPITVKFEDLRGASGGLDAKKESPNFGPVWRGGEWHLRDITNYMISAAFSLLNHAADNRERWLSRFYEIGKEAVRPRKDGEIKGIILPLSKFGRTSGPTDYFARQELIEIFSRAGVKVDEPEVFKYKNSNFEQAAVIRFDQPYGNFAKTLLENQSYPNLLDEKGNPISPYDVTAHTLTLLAGISIVPFDKDLVITKSGKRRGQGRGYGCGCGCSGGGPCDCSKYYAIYKSSIPVMDEGWTRWVTENADDFKGCYLKYPSISDKDLRDGGLNRNRAIIFPDQSANQILNGYAKGTMPDEYTGGVGKEGVENLKKFVEAGGTLVFLNRSTEFAIEQFNLPIRNVVKDLPRKDFFIPGSILRTELDLDSPIAKGMPQQSIAWFENSPAFEIVSGSVPSAVAGGLTSSTTQLQPPSTAGGTDKMDIRVIARYPTDTKSILLSGWALGAETIAGKAALVEIKMGKGKIILFGFRPQYRGQSLATFPLLFNAISN